MRKHFMIGAVALCLLVANARGQGDSKEAKPLLVGVVDLDVIFTKYDRKADFEKEINARKTDFEKEAMEQQGELERLRDRIAKADAEDRPKLEGDLRVKIATFKAQREEWESTLKRDLETLTLMLLDEMETEIRAYGKEKGFDLIIKTGTKVFGDERFQERLFRAQVTAVVYRSSSLDVTKEILERLNNFSKKKGVRKK